MRKQDIICTICPMGCHIYVTGEGENIQSVEGHTCPRGEEYARSEFVCPMRTLTTTVRVKNSSEPMLAARTTAPIPKAKLFECMDMIRGAVFCAPIKAHQVLIHNIAGTGVDLVACTDREGL